MNLLLMESSPEEHVVVKDAVAQVDAGAIFYGATSCQDALTHLASYGEARLEYVFLDLALPAEDGYCLKTFKDSMYLRGMPVLRCSQQDRTVNTLSMLKHSAYLSISKSQSFLSLCNELKRMVALNWRKDIEVLTTGFNHQRPDLAF